MPDGQIRILHIITKLAVGGAQLNTLISTRDISHKGYHSDILTGPEKPLEGDLFSLGKKWGLNIITIPHLKRDISPLSDFLALFEIKEVLRKGNYNIVHTHGSKARFLGRIATSSFENIKTIQTAHGWPFYKSMNSFKKFVYISLEKIGFNLADLNICVSPRDRDKALHYGIGYFDDYRIIRSGVEFDEFRATRGSRTEARRKLGIDDETDIVGSVMRFCPEKAPDQFIRVAAGIIDKKPKTKFFLVGDGPLRIQTEKLIDSLNLKDSILLLGSRRDVVEILPAFDVFLITSRTEGLPRALLESLAAGIPVVSTDVGGIHELIKNGRNGYLSAEGDNDSLVADVIRILDSPGMTKELIANVDEDLEPFSASMMVEDLFALYTKISSPSMNIVFLCDNEPFNIPKTIASIIRKSPFNRYTIISMRGHGSLKKPLINLRRYMSLYGIFGFFVQLFRFLIFRISGKLRFPTKASHSLKQTAIMEHTDYATLDRVNSKHSREYLKSLDPDLFISMACPQILKKKTLEIPRLGAWNVHSALLPSNRGMLPSFWSLYHGDTPGVTLHKMVPRLDAGGILIQKEIDCSINDTSLHQLLNTTKELAAEIVSEGLDIIERGDYTLLPNPQDKATVNTFPERKDVLKFRNMGGRITGIMKKRQDIAISFDVEEWFQTYAARKWYPRKDWNRMDDRLNGIIDKILQILDEHKARATFFFLGWIVERHPEFVHRILEKGHEIGYHGYNHEELSSLTREEFSVNLDRFLKLLVSLSIPQPVGFRAPSFSLKKNTSWAVDEIRSRGFKYDSSVYPMFKLRYGTPEAPLKPFNLNGEKTSIIELPLASIPLAGSKIPIAGGAYLRFYPELLHRLMLKRLSKSNITPVLYFHPWEIDSMNISRRMSFIQRFRQHHNSGKNTISKLHWILRHYRGITLRELSEQFKDREMADFNL